MNKYKFVSVDIDKCVGCRVCEYACSMEKNKAFNPTRSRIRVVRLYPHTNAALNCRMCQDSPCVTACPRKALKQSEENGVIHVDIGLCDGCGWCIKVCEFGAITLDTESKVSICDLCEGREGGSACIEWCPEKALELTTNDAISQKARISAVEKMAE
ncbi:MAG: 4Fe-4S dicluster domain-containing protein [Oscillospiraceae bacterium]|nr:4Fe-4S dicluster domain-containing protein [Oscillospiraceae bacterium]